MTRRVTPAWTSFLLAGGEFEAMLLLSTVVSERPITSFLSLQETALPAAYLVAAAAAAVMFVIAWRRNRKLARDGSWAEPVDAGTLRDRIAVSDRAAPAPPATRTRELLDTVRKREGTTGVSGAAGSSRRR